MILVKIMVITALLLAGLTAVQLIILGAIGGIGPLKFLAHNRMSKHPGNANVYHPENIKPLETSPLEGKRFLFLGSSVTNGSASLEVSMADYISILDRCEVLKEAANGTTIADKNRFSYLSRLKKINTGQHFDAVICQLSTNDAAQKVEVGVVTHSKETNGFDVFTVAGALEAIIAYVYETWHCPVFIYTGVQYNSEKYQAMVDILPTLKEKWDIFIVDLWNDKSMQEISEEERCLFLNDDVHPTQAGYLSWWVPKFQQALYAYFSEKTEN